MAPSALFQDADMVSPQARQRWGHGGNGRQAANLAFLRQILDDKSLLYLRDKMLHTSM